MELTRPGARRRRTGGRANARGGAAAGLLFALWVAATGTQPASASCNLIPGTTTAFRGTLGTVDRPFARPGDFVRLSLDPTCHRSSPGFLAGADDHVVTVLFAPPRGPRN